MTDRFVQLQAWVANALDIDRVVLEPVIADASFRRYFRVTVGLQSHVVMDAPPPQENCRSFVTVARLLKHAGVHAPEVLAADLERGFLLLSDLGKQSYLEVLNEDNAETLFKDAVRSLLKWQLASRPGQLPVYDRALLRRELNLFTDWYVLRHLNVSLSSSEQNVLDSIFKVLEDSALAQPGVYVHRDYMPRNLMLSSPNPGVLDLQDAVFGPISYDLLSLFKDAFISWSPEQINGWRRCYWELARNSSLPVQSLPDFERAFDWIGMQRHLKVLGIFARINYRDGKPAYLKDTPRFLNYVRDTGRLYKEFTPLLKLLDSLENRAQHRLTAQ
ncbi:MAG: phosphotransferase [Gammaproteobacteria bacterium]|nr:phosphotransferase [Gammaproteobacteria bacterium]